MILSLNMQEEALLNQYMEQFRNLGFEIEPFGGKEYAISAVPADFFGIAEKTLFVELLDGLSEQTGRLQADVVQEKIASMSCKAAVKGNHKMSALEAEALIDELLHLENPYNCPHGRPTIISMTKYELEKKFKRIV
jgi:DNA mismatch repair protein MutL